MNKIKTLSFLLAFTALQSRATFVPVTISSGFNQDVIANGVGNANVSTTLAVDLSNFNLVAADFKALVTDAPPTNSLPSSGTINSVATSGLTFQLASYTGNNALLLTAASSSGTLNFGTPRSGDVYVLGMTGNGPTAADIKVKFTDNTFQTFTNIDFPDWYGGSGFAIQNIGRINRTNNALEYPAGDPRLYERKLTLSAANYAKQINAIEVTKANATGVLTIYAVTVCTVPVISSNPQDKSICEGANTSFAVTATNAATYKWQVNTGSGFINVSDNAVYSGSSTATLNLTAPSAVYNNYAYRCIVKSGCNAEATSAGASLLIKPVIAINLPSTAASACTKGSVVINMPHAGVANSYQWQIFTSTSGFVDISAGFPYSGTTSNALVIQEAPDAMNGNIYRCIVTGDCNTEISDPITLTVYPAPFFDKDPVDVNTTVGTGAYFYVLISGHQYILYWQVSSDKGNTYVNVSDNALYSGCKTGNLTVHATRPQDDSLMVRCVLRSKDPICGKLEDTSKAAYLLVKNPASVHDVSKNAAFSIYPNPVTGDELFISSSVSKSSVAQISITDNLGRTVYSDKLPLSQNTKVSLPHNMPPGIYVLRLNSEADNATVKFIKQ